MIRFGKQTFSSLDVAANINLLDAARQARVLRFAYVSVFGAEGLGHLDYVRGHEEVVCALRESRLDHVVIRPTGVFSAFEQMLHIARLGAMPEIRSGAARSNPIDDRDLAAACVDALEGEDGERSIGGPETLSRREMGLLAFEAVGLSPRFRPAPAWMFRGGGSLVRSTRGSPIS